MLGAEFPLSIVNMSKSCANIRFDQVYPLQYVQYGQQSTEPPSFGVSWKKKYLYVCM